MKLRIKWFTKIILFSSLVISFISVGNEYNAKYDVSYKLNIDNNTAEILFLDKNKNLTSTLILLNKAAYIEKEKLREFCSSDDVLCPRKSYESNVITWSPDNEYLAVFVGNTKGFWFIPSKEITKAAFNKNNVVKVGVHTQNDKINIALFHGAAGWVDNHHYVFSAGLSGDNFVYKFNPKTKELKGFPFELNEDSTVSSFKEVFVESFNSQKSSFKLSDVIQQLDKLK
ncbi:hypothetical protein I6F48_15445 [Pseudoalteromonas sp. SWYJ118]|uniref:hypothetical protein n=1 Tax=Pseudoalteromonas sp. SWYJ118 TaxID=2792062 RepID=UPI0018CCBD69|nr:hypothetical protein [Pseudoalteromonas sp. SWYJ118]MBH0076919.1 hypothetical protein [Pseudoalteromonas sp. SWYJ118]